MNETTWQQSTEPDLMLGFIDASASSRKLRLLCCAYARRVWERIADSDASCLAVNVAVKYADGQATQDELASAFHQAEQAVFVSDVSDVKNARRAAAWCAAASVDAVSVTRSVAWAAVYASREVKLTERSIQAQLLRDVFHNPFRPVAFQSQWKTNNVVAIARYIYDTGDYGSMPILADALEEAECTDLEVLSHCRHTQAHVRGCWVVDLLLGKD